MRNIWSENRDSLRKWSSERAHWSTVPFFPFFPPSRCAMAIAPTYYLLSHFRTLSLTKTCLSMPKPGHAPGSLKNCRQNRSVAPASDQQNVKHIDGRLGNVPVRVPWPTREPAIRWERYGGGVDETSAGSKARRIINRAAYRTALLVAHTLSPACALKARGIETLNGDEVGRR